MKNHNDLEKEIKELYKTTPTHAQRVALAKLHTAYEKKALKLAQQHLELVRESMEDEIKILKDVKLQLQL